ncbi:MAG: NERD domain-containing protein [Candidatus Methylumidiphilus sp.]
MDFTPILKQALLFWYFVPIIILLGILKSPWFKGLVGEAKVNLAIRLFLNKKEYHPIKNVTLPTEDGTTQIDHIIVSKYGIFVVETKNMKGWIFGDPNQPTWTQKIYRHTSKFQNPLRQNYKHTKTLESSLGLNGNQIHSVIVFVGDCMFKTEMPENVTYAGGFIRFVKSKRDVVFSSAEIEKIIASIESTRLSPSFKTHFNHVKHVKSIVNEKQSSKSCPICGNLMILRESKKGIRAGQKFWGCSKYPQCKGILSAT